MVTINLNNNQFLWFFVVLILSVSYSKATINCVTGDNSTSYNYTYSRICESKLIECEDNADCRIDCLTDDSCINMKVICPLRYECNINCFGKSSCNSISLHAQNSSKLQINCYEEYGSCANSEIYCPTTLNSSCIINGETSVEKNDTLLLYPLDNTNIYAINGFDDVTFQNIDYQISNLRMHCLDEYDISCKVIDSFPFNSCKHGTDICIIHNNEKQDEEILTAKSESSSSTTPIPNISVRDTTMDNNNDDLPAKSALIGDVTINTKDIWILYVMVMALMVLCCICIAMMSVLLVCCYCRERNDTKKIIHEVHEKILQDKGFNEKHGQNNHHQQKKTMHKQVQSGSITSPNSSDSLENIKSINSDNYVNVNANNGHDTMSIKANSKHKDKHRKKKKNKRAHTVCIEMDKINSSPSSNAMSSSSSIAYNSDHSQMERINLNGNIRIVPLNDVQPQPMKINKFQSIDTNDTMTTHSTTITSTASTQNGIHSNGKHNYLQISMNTPTNDSLRVHKQSAVGPLSPQSDTNGAEGKQKLPQFTPSMVPLYTRSEENVVANRHSIIDTDINTATTDDKFDSLITSVPSPPPSEICTLSNPTIPEGHSNQKFFID